MKVKIDVEVKLPAVPYALEFGDSIDFPSSRALGEFTDEELEQVAAEWKKQLLERAAEQRAKSGKQAEPTKVDRTPEPPPEALPAPESQRYEALDEPVMEKPKGRKK